MDATREPLPPLLRATARRRCPACGRGDWCLVSEAGDAAICQRVASSRPRREAGWLHVLREPGWTAPPRPDGAPKNAAKKKLPPEHWASEVARLAAGVGPAQAGGFLRSLGLPGGGPGLPGLGYDPADRWGPCWSLPMRDGRGRVVGLSRRYLAPIAAERHRGKTKLAAAGCSPGAFVPAGWNAGAGPVLVPEGASDALALRAAGLAAVGRFSCHGPAAPIAELLASAAQGRAVVVLAERDQKRGGEWPGRDGAVSSAREIARRLKRPVAWSLPPAGGKDAREWLTRPELAGVPWQERGRRLLAGLSAELPD